MTSVEKKIFFLMQEVIFSLMLVIGLLYDMKVKSYLINQISKHHRVCQKYFHQKLVTFHAYNYDIAFWQNILAVVTIQHP